MAGDDKNKTIRENATIREKNVRAGIVARVDQFEVVRKLGAGGFGSVYLAKDTVSCVDVALKVVGHGVETNVTIDEKKDCAGTIDELRENFRLVQELSHDNIATAYPLHPVKEVNVAHGVTGGLDVRSGDVLAVLKFAPGITLDRWRKMFRDERVPFKDALEIVSQIASALDYAHGKGIIHRDIKPSNVMIETRSGQSPKARLLDFGLAAAADGSGARGEICGTPRYMAPEQWTGGAQDARTDQYALAVMTCELLTGHVPYEAAFQSGDEEVMRTAVTGRDVDLPEDLSPRQHAIFVRALAKKPAERFATCSEFVRAMRRTVSRSCPWPCVAGVALAVSAMIVIALMISREDKDAKERSRREGVSYGVGIASNHVKTSGVQVTAAMTNPARPAVRQADVSTAVIESASPRVERVEAQSADVSGAVKTPTAIAGESARSSATENVQLRQSVPFRPGKQVRRGERFSFKEKDRLRNLCNEEEFLFGSPDFFKKRGDIEASRTVANIKDGYWLLKRDATLCKERGDADGYVIKMREAMRLMDEFVAYYDKRKEKYK